MCVQFTGGRVACAEEKRAKRFLGKKSRVRFLKHFRCTLVSAAAAAPDFWLQLGERPARFVFHSSRQVLFLTDPQQNRPNITLFFPSSTPMFLLFPMDKKNYSQDSRACSTLTDAPP